VNLSLALANRGKRSIAHNRQDEQSRATMERLLETADLSLISLRPNALRRLGLDADQAGYDNSVDLGSRYEKAKASAPTRPHPHAPDTPPANKMLGPIAVLFESARRRQGNLTGSCGRPATESASSTSGTISSELWLLTLSNSAVAGEVRFPARGTGSRRSEVTFGSLLAWPRSTVGAEAAATGVT